MQIHPVASPGIVAMTHFSSERFNLRARPWLVLWLLPYLVLSVMAGGHSHRFDDGHGSEAHGAPVAASLSSAVSASAATISEASDAVQDAAHSAWCLACQWAAFAAAILVSPVALSTFAAASLLFALVHLQPSRRAYARAAVRGPPSA